MNSFDKIFFKKYIPEGQEMIHIIHIHPIVILGNLIVIFSLFIVLPIFLYYFSPTLQKQIPFFYLEIYLIFTFLKVIYDIFNWYTDVWILTNTSIVALDWSFLKTKTDSISYSNIEGMWVDEDGIVDKILKKWWLVIHKFWEEEFILEDAINPYNVIDLIDSLNTKEEKKEEKTNITDERFNQLLDAISWAVWDHVYTKSSYGIPKFENEDIKNEVIKKAESEDWTIDLRD